MWRKARSKADDTTLAKTNGMLQRVTAGKELTAVTGEVDR